MPHRILVFTLFTCAVVLAQAPKPFLMPIEDGATSAVGNFNPVTEGTAPTWALCEVTNSSCIPKTANFSVDLVRGTFQATPENRFVEKHRIQVQLTYKGATSFSEIITVKDKPLAAKVVLLNVSAVYGTKKAVVQFQPPGQLRPTPTLRVRYGEYFDIPVVLKEDDLKAGFVELALPMELIGSGNLSVSADPPGSATDHVSKRPDPARIQITGRPPRDGDRKITGSAPASVERVCVAIIGASFDAPEILSFSDADHALTSCDAARRVERCHHVRSLLGKLKSNKEPGCAAEDPESESTNRVRAYASVAALSGPLLEEQEVPVARDTATFEVNLNRPLAAGSKIFIRQVFNTAAGRRVSFRGPLPETVSTSGIDFGRTRFFLTVGASIGQSNDSFGKADPYVAFHGDGTFFNSLVSRRSVSDVQNSAETAGRGSARLTDLFDTRRAGVSLHWTTSVRLTQTGTPTAPGASPTLQSAQSAIFQVGMYLPVRVRGMDWVHEGTQYSAYLAPIVKGGVTSVKDGIPLRKVTTTTETSIAPCPIADCSALSKSTQDTAILRTTGPAPFFGYGARLGVMQYGLMGRTIRNRQVSPDPIAYIDFLFGQNEAYVTPGESSTATSPPVPNGNLSTTVKTVSQGYTYQTRTMIEARVKFPYLPAELGVDVNYNLKAPVRSSFAGKDNVNLTEFRFILGFRMDMAKALNTLLDTAKK